MVMSELQLALIGFGALLVAAVWGYNLWQEKKQRRQVEAALPPAKPDVLMAGRGEPEAEVRREPEIASFTVPREPTFGAPEIPVEESPVAAMPAADNGALPPGESRPAAPLPAEWADGRADCLLRIEFVDPVAVPEIWAEQAAWAHKLDKPLQWLGYTERDGGGRWHALLPQESGEVLQVAAALQLADRRGALREVTLATFLDGMHKLAQRFAGLVELPEPGPVLAAARELDAFCAGVDVQLSLHVVPRPGSIAEMVGARLVPALDACGLKREGERFVATDAEGAEAFALTCQTAGGAVADRLESQALVDLTFSIDVPRVADGAAAFERMTACARQCADALGGQLADPQRKPLAEATGAAIRARIVDLQAGMARMGIPAGGVRALRLFS
jgi:FtsZ-interacting cell division protein ZipA